MKQEDRFSALILLFLTKVYDTSTIVVTILMMAGDKVLVKMANTLTKSVRETDTVVRHGVDEFLILLPDLKEYYNYKLIANRILCADKKVKVTGDVEIDISLSMGISFYPKDGDTIDQLILKADEAMYNVKRMGGDKCIKYN